MSQQINQTELEQLQMRFIVGSDAPLTVDQCPKPWQSALESTPTEFLPLATLALLSHYQNSQEMPTPSEALTALPVFPKLSLPELPKRWHSVIAGIIDNDSEQHFFIPMLQFLACRGYVIPPHLWQKETNHIKKMGDYPKVYHPWRAWFNQQDADFMLSDEAISVENWDDFYPAARCEALRELRKTDPKAAREIIAACFAREKSEQRIKIIEVFNENLSLEDAPFLHSLKGDRSGQVRNAASILLAQIEEPDEEMIAEQVAAIKSQFTIKEVSKEKFWYLKAKKTGHQDLIPLLETVQLKRFVEAFNLSERDIIAAWDWPHNTWVQNTIFIKKIVQNYHLSKDLEGEKGNIKNDHIYMILKTMLRHDYSHVDNDAIAMLWRILTPAEQHEVFLSDLLDKSVHLRNLSLASDLLLITPPLEEGKISFEALKKTQLWYLIYMAEKKAKENPLHYQFANLCTALGFFLPRDLAQAFYHHITEQFGECSTGMLFLNVNLT